MGAASSDDELDLEVELPPSSPPPENTAFHPHASTVVGLGNIQGPAGAFFSLLTFLFNILILSLILLASDLFNFANACCEEFGLSDSLKEDALRCAKVSIKPGVLIACVLTLYSSCLCSCF
jgi:hypothetical protein